MHSSRPTWAGCYRVTPLAMSSVVQLLLNPPTRLQYRICKCCRNWPRPMSNLALLIGWHCGCFFPRDRMRCGAACSWSYTPVSPAVYRLSVWHKKERCVLCAVCSCATPWTPWGHRSVCMYSRQLSRVNNATIRAKKEMRYKYLDKLTVWKLKLHLFWW